MYVFTRYVLHSSPVSHAVILTDRPACRILILVPNMFILSLHVLRLFILCAFPQSVYCCACICVDALIVSAWTFVRAYVCVCVYIFPAALPPGMQHGSSEGDISADRRASFPSPLPSGVALNIKLFNLIQFPTTNTLDWIQMPPTSGPTPGLVCALDTLELGTGAGTETRIKAGTGSGDADGAPVWTGGVEVVLLVEEEGELKLPFGT